MKSFLAGLGLGMAAAVAYRRRPSSRNRQRLPEAGSWRTPQNQTRIPAGATTEPPPAARLQPAVKPAAVSVAGRRPKPAAVSRPGNAEEVLNSATRQQLLSVYGIGPVLADRIIQNRPYAAAYDVVEQGIIPESLFIQLRKQLLDQPS